MPVMHTCDKMMMYVCVLIYYIYIVRLSLGYCEQKYPSTAIDKLQRDLTSKCGEERRRLTIA